MEKRKWFAVIKPKTGWLELNLKDVWKYRDLILLFVKRNFATMYKQTILGPAWIIINPLLSTLISTFVFHNVAGIKPGAGVPYFLFYMCGNMTWYYFSYCLNSTSSTFLNNAGLFGKVYFPRLVTPLSVVITGLLNFLIQVATFVGFYIYFAATGCAIAPNIYALLYPVLIVQMACMGLGVGIIVSSLTTKYRDLTVLVSFGVQLWMYITPIIYNPSESTLFENKFFDIICKINPMASVVEMAKYGLLGPTAGSLNWGNWVISLVETAVVLFVGIIIFNRVEKTFMDTV